MEKIPESNSIVTFTAEELEGDWAILMTQFLIENYPNLEGFGQLLFKLPEGGGTELKNRVIDQLKTMKPEIQVLAGFIADQDYEVYFQIVEG